MVMPKGMITALRIVRKVCFLVSHNLPLFINIQRYPLTPSVETSAGTSFLGNQEDEQVNHERKSALC
jgi:hypothetical protein